MKSLSSLSMVSALIGVGLLLCACDDNKESLIQEKIKKEFGEEVDFLSFEEAQKEVGLKNEECLKEKGQYSNNDYRFFKTSNGDIEVMVVGESIENGAILISLIHLDTLKEDKSECFN